MKLAYPIATPEVRGPILGLKGTLDEMLRALVDFGYEGIEPFMTDPAKFDVDAWSRTVERSGLAVVTVGTGPCVFDDALTFTSENASVRRAAVERAKEITRFAARFGSQVNIGKLRGEISATHPEQSWAWMREAFKEVCNEAAQHNTIITLEPQSRGIINNLNTTAAAIEFAAELGLPNFKLMLDSFHMEAEREDLGSGVRAAATSGQLLHVHFADTSRKPPGDGSIDFEAVIAVLHSVGYDRAVTVEIKQEPDAHTAARRSAEYLRPLLVRGVDRKLTPLPRPGSVA